jgi:uncharacterized surface protein with fasciclin (FAS1) repeats
MDLDSIHKRISMIDGLQRQNRETREMLKAELENDENYRQALEQADEVNKEKKRIKEEIENSGSNKQLVETIRENNEELSTLKEILSAELAQVYVEKKSDEIVDADGDVRKFKISAQLMSKRGNYENRDSFGKFTESEKE